VQAFKSGRSLLKARSERDAVFWAASQAPNIDLAPSPAHMVAKEPVAQPVEHLTFNQGVMGSNPIGLTNKSIDQFEICGPAGKAEFRGTMDGDPDCGM
jgi:hypothetical protein